MIKAIIFDLGGVIISKGDGTAEFLKKIFPTTLKKSTLLFKKYLPNLQNGKISIEEFFSLLLKDSPDKKPVEHLVNIWNSEFKKVSSVNNLMMDLVRKLRSRYKVYLFTNTNYLHSQFNRARGIYADFDNIFNSFEEGIRKPEVQAFLYVLQKINLKPEDCIFIDDLEENVKSARMIGIRGIIFHNTDHLKAELGKLGVKI